MYDPDYLLSLPSIPVPASVTAVAGCSCGGTDWHKQDCTIWSLSANEINEAVDGAHQRLAEHTDELNRQFQAALRAVKEA